MFHEQSRRAGNEPLADKIIERIEQEGVTPKPRWRFTLLNRLFWLLWGVSILFAVASAGAMIFALANAGWEFRAVTHDSFVAYLVDVLPLFWIAAIVLLLLLAHETVRRTKLGYRYPVKTVVGFGALGVLLGGFVLFASGWAQDVEQGFGKRIPLYHPALEYQRRIWVNPERGLLAGEVTATEPEYATFTVRTFDGVVWIVNGDDLRDRDRAYLTAHRVVRMVGVPAFRAGDASSTFHACFVFPWEVYGRKPFEAARDGFPAPPPTGGMFVRKFDGERSTECKGVRPYTLLKSMRRE